MAGGSVAQPIFNRLSIHTAWFTFDAQKHTGHKTGKADHRSDPVPAAQLP